MRTRSRLPMVIMIGVLTLIGPLADGPTGALSAPSFLPAPWKVDVAPYAWLPVVQGDVTVRGRTAAVDLNLGDTLDLLLDAFQFAAMGRAEARKGNLLFTLDGLMHGPLLEAVFRVSPAALPCQERHGRMGQRPHGATYHSQPEKRT
jgi:hypothetical protein